VSGRRVAFVGPTLAAAERPRLGVEYLPPARHGDLFALGLRRGDAVLVVDGVYQQFAPLRHKEILAALAAGVRVYGAASYGALRAAELAASGMVGVGRVAAAYGRGELSGDADVAVLHSDDDACRRLTVALVSIRWATRDLVEAGRLDATSGEAVVALAAGLHYTERSPSALRARARAAALAPAVGSVLAALEGGGDVKRQDALEALRLLGGSGGGLPDRPAERWGSSYGVETEFEHAPVARGRGLSARRLLACLQIHDPEYPERHRAYVRRVAGAPAAGALEAAGFCVAEVERSRWARATAATSAWSPAERALVRTFRLPPGRSVYRALPPEALDGEAIDDVAARWAARIARAPTASEAASRLARMWGAGDGEELALCALERGFRDLDEALRLADGLGLDVATPA
jgi:hypothetical protein